MRTLTAALLTLAFTGAAYGQSTVVSIPIAVPPPVAFTIPVNQSTTINGIAGTLSGTLTWTPTAGTPSPPAGNSSITSVTNSANQPLTTAPAGNSIVVKGSGFGTFGTATVAGLSATVQTWTPAAVTLKLPVAGSAAGSASGPIVLKPGDAPPAATAFDFTITGLSASLPPADGPTWESPIIAVSQTLPDPLEPTDTSYIPVEEPAIELPPLGPLLTAVLDANRQPFTTLFDLDQPLTLEGRQFGTTAGFVELDGVKAEVLSWGDEQIIINPQEGGSWDQLSVLVRTPTSYYYGAFDLRQGG